MKKQFLMFAVIVASLTLMISCNKEDLPLQEPALTETVDNPALKKVAPQAVDLTITSYKTDIPSTTTICSDVALPNIHCNGGTRSFTAFATITNLGSTSLAAGTLQVRWDDFGFGNSFVQTVPHNGIPPQGTLIASRPYYVGPCDCVNIPGPNNCFSHSYSATVDPNNQISETNEGNNTSGVYDACDGCGDCAVASDGGL